MKKIFLLASIPFSLIILNSCTGCVKSVSKKIAESGIAAVDGVTEVLDEHGEKLGESTANVAIKILSGAAKSIDKQMEEHAKAIEAENGKPNVSTIDTISTDLLNQFYDKKNYTEVEISSEASINFIGKLKHSSVIDTYMKFQDEGTYRCDIALTDYINKDVIIDATSNKYVIVSFAITPEEEEYINNGEIKISVSKID